MNEIFKVAFAVTIHKIQGATLPAPQKVVIDINSTFEPAQCYVALSRIQQMDQLFILSGFDKKKIKVFQHALNELRRLKSISINENPSPWTRKDDKIKLCFLNCAGLRPHFQDIKADKFLLNATILQFVETSIPRDAPTDNLEIDGYNSTFLNLGRGRGASTYVRNETVKFSKNFIDTGVQISKFVSEELCLLIVYRSQNGNIGNLLENLISLISDNKAVLITGDFNLCNNKRKDNAIKTTLNSEGFKLLIFEPTQILGGFIDHAYWRDMNDKWDEPTVERYSPYYSDHDALCITIKQKVILINIYFID